MRMTPQRARGESGVADHEANEGAFHRDLFRAVFEKAPIGVFTSRPDGKNLDVNPALAGMLGYDSPQEVLANLAGLATRLLHDSGERPEDVKIIRQAPDLIVFSYKYTRPDGSSFIAFLHVCTITEPFSGTPYILGLVEDVTDMRNLQDKLAESEQRHRSLFEKAPVGIYQSTPDGTYLSVNPEFARLHGFSSPQELIDEVEDSSVQLYASPQRRRELLATLERHDEAVNFEALARRKDGSTFWSMRNVRLIRDAQGRPERIKGFVTDINERKQLESVREDVESIIRHDLKSPVVAMLAGLKMLSWRPLMDEDMDLVNELMGTAERMLHMLELSNVMHRIEQECYTLEPEPVDVTALLHEVSESMLASFPDRSISLEKPPADQTPCLIMVEPLLARTIVENLMKNALEATPDLGEVTITVSVSEDDVCIVAFHNPLPVPKVMRGRFFDKYATAGKSSGTGLGTYSAKLCTEAMGGCIRMTTSEEDGTTVTVQLPLA